MMTISIATLLSTMTITTSIVSAHFVPSERVTTCFLSPKNKYVMQQSLDSTSLNSEARYSSFLDARELERSQFCADHFGECDLQEIEDLRKKLHTERVTHFFDETSGIASVLNAEDELDHILLEEDLTLQLAMLQEENKMASRTAILSEENAQSVYQPIKPNLFMASLPETFALFVALVILTFAPQIINV